MLFPEKPRVIYKQNPLVEVICQFRYPTILRIDSEEPVDFQDRIRKDFPIYREKPNVGIQLPHEIAQLVPPEILNSLGKGIRAFEFGTQDNDWVISLTRDFVALTNANYTRWEGFYERLEKPIQALNEVFAPAYISRVGLRYQNIIQRSVHNLNGVSWSELINPALAGLLVSAEKQEDIDEIRNIALLNLDDNLGKVRIRSGTIIESERDEQCFIVDSDFFAEGERNINDALSIIKEFNRINRNFFRWCITDRLHDAMEPETI